MIFEREHDANTQSVLFFESGEGFDTKFFWYLKSDRFQCVQYISASVYIWYASNTDTPHTFEVSTLHTEAYMDTYIRKKYKYRIKYNQIILYMFTSLDVTIICLYTPQVLIRKLYFMIIKQTENLNSSYIDHSLRDLGIPVVWSDKVLH